MLSLGILLPCHGSSRVCRELAPHLLRACHSLDLFRESRPCCTSQRINTLPFPGKQTMLHASTHTAHQNSVSPLQPTELTCLCDNTRQSAHCLPHELCINKSIEPRQTATQHLTAARLGIAAARRRQESRQRKTTAKSATRALTKRWSEFCISRTQSTFEMSQESR